MFKKPDTKTPEPARTPELQHEADVTEALEILQSAIDSGQFQNVLAGSKIVAGYEHEGTRGRYDHMGFNGGAVYSHVVNLSIQNFKNSAKLKEERKKANEEELERLKASVAETTAKIETLARELGKAKTNGKS